MTAKTLAERSASYRQRKAEREARMELALESALTFAVVTLAFFGRERGTERQENALDDLADMAKLIDGDIRRAIEK